MFNSKKLKLISDSSLVVLGILTLAFGGAKELAKKEKASPGLSDSHSRKRLFIHQLAKALEKRKEKSQPRVSESHLSKRLFTHQLAHDNTRI